MGSHSPADPFGMGICVERNVRGLKPWQGTKIKRGNMNILIAFLISIPIGLICSYLYFQFMIWLLTNSIVNETIKIYNKNGIKNEY